MATYSGKSLEWLNQNLSRAYPLDDSTGGMPDTIPCRMLVDCLLFVENIDRTSVYISALDVNTDSVVLSLVGHTPDGELVAFQKAITLFYTFNFGDQVDFSSTARSGAGVSATISGYVIVGDLGSISRATGTYYVSAAAGRLFTGLVIPQIDCVRSITVGDATLTGDIEIVVGDGVLVSVDGNTINITADIATIIGDLVDPVDLTNKLIVDDAELVDKALSQFGTPITNISGVSPDPNGNIDISPALWSDGELVEQERNSDHVVPELSGGNNTLTLTLDRDPFLEADTIQNALKNIDQLSIRCNLLDRAQTEMDNAISAAAGRLTRL